MAMRGGVRSWKDPKSTKPIGEDASVPANYQSDSSSDEDATSVLSMLTKQRSTAATGRTSHGSRRRSQTVGGDEERDSTTPPVDKKPRAIIDQVDSDDVRFPEFQALRPVPRHSQRRAPQ
jgi:hypothetical protein